MSHRTFNDPHGTSAEARQALLDNRCEHGPKRHRTKARRKRLSIAKRQRIKHIWKCRQLHAGSTTRRFGPTGKMKVIIHDEFEHEGQSMKPICYPCHRFFRPDKNGVWFTEGMPAGNARAEPGLAAPEQWKPYKIWQGDRWRCHGCGAVIIVGVAQQPIAEHFQDGFARAAADTGADGYQVNDC